MRGNFLREAKAQADANALCEMIPHHQRVMLVGADDEVDVVPADGARVAGVSLCAQHLADRFCDRGSLVVVDPEDGEVEQVLMLSVKVFQFTAGGLLEPGFSSMVNGSQGLEFEIAEVGGSGSAGIVDCPVTVEGEDEMNRDDA